MISNVTMASLGSKRYSFVSTTSSYRSSDDIAITPCHTPSPHSTPASSTHEPSRPPTPVHKHTQHTHHHHQKQQHDDVASHTTEYSPFKELMYAPPPGQAEGCLPDVETLWNRMLLVQMCCGLYNSARLNAAIETGEFERFMPTKSTLDMMNDCVTMRPEDVMRLKVGIEIKENKLRKYMPPAWKLH